MANDDTFVLATLKRWLELGAVISRNDPDRPVLVHSLNDGGRCFANLRVDLPPGVIEFPGFSLDGIHVQGAPNLGTKLNLPA